MPSISKEKFTNMKSVETNVFDICKWHFNRPEYNKIIVDEELLRLSIRRRLLKKLWNDLDPIVHLKAELNLPNKQKLSYSKKIIKKTGNETLEEYAQLVVTEVEGALNKDETLTISTFRKIFLSKIDEKIKTCERVLFDLLETDAKQSPVLVEILKSQINYLYDLYESIYVMEKMINAAIKNKGLNYTPTKSTEMLNGMIDVLHRYMGNPNESVKSVIITYVTVTMPEVAMDQQLLNAMLSDLLPFANRYIDHSNELEANKKKFFDDKNQEEVKYRNKILADVGVSFESLTEMVNDLIPKNPTLGLSEKKEGKEEVDNSKLEKKPIKNADNSYAPYLEKIFWILSYANDNKVVKEFLPSSLKEYILMPLNSSQQKVSGFVSYIKQNVEPETYNDIILLITNALGKEAYAKLFTIDDPFKKIWDEFEEKPSKNLNTKTTIDKIADDLINPKEKDEADLNHLNTQTIQAFLAFYEKIKIGNIDEKLEKYFFDKTSSTQNYSFPFDYVKYSRFKKNLQKWNYPEGFSLDGLSSMWADVSDNNAKKVLIVFMHSRLQKIQNNDIEKFGIYFDEILYCRDTIEKLNDKALSKFNSEYIDPMLKKLTHQFLNKKYLKLLEEFIDEIKIGSGREKEKIEIIYSKLMSYPGYVLSINELNYLIDIDSKNQIINAQDKQKLNKLMDGILPKINSEKSEKIEIAKTPQQKYQGNINSSVSNANVLLDNIIANLKSQKEKCDLLKKAVGEKSELGVLCKNKIDYINSIMEFYSGAKKYITGNEELLAKKIIEVQNNPSLISSNIKNQTFSDIIKQAMNYAWILSPAYDNGNAAMPSLNSILHWYVNSVNHTELDLANKKFTEHLEKNKFPELLSMVGDPLAIANFTPSQEQAMDFMLGKAKEFTTENQENVMQAITGVANFIVPGWSQMINPENIKNIANKPEVAKLLNHNADKLQDHARLKLYGYLDIEMKNTVENNVFLFAKKYSTGEMEMVGREDFLTYYSQYRSIKIQNQNVTASTCVELLFSDNLSIEKQNYIAKTFEKYDEDLKIQNKNDIKEIDDLINFLIKNYSLDNEKNAAVMQVMLINRLLLIKLNSFEALNHELTEQEIQNFRNYFDDLLNIIKTDYSLLKPSHGKFEELFTKKLTKQLSNVTLDIEKETVIRDEQLQESSEYPFGKTVLKTEYERATSHRGRMALTVLNRVWDAISFLSVWQSIYYLFSGSLPLVKAVLGVLQLGSFVGLGVMPIALGVVVLLNFAGKLGAELWWNRKNFSNIYNDKDISGLNKVAKIGLLAGKCVLVALTRAVFTDFIGNRIINAVSAISFKLPSIRNLFRTYPDRNKVEQENEYLKTVQSSLNQIKQKISCLGSGDQINNLKNQFEQLKTEIEKEKKPGGKLFISYNDARDSHDAKHKPNANIKLISNQLNEINKMVSYLDIFIKSNNPSDIKDIPIVKAKVEPNITLKEKIKNVPVNIKDYEKDLQDQKIASIKRHQNFVEKLRTISKGIGIGIGLTFLGIIGYTIFAPKAKEGENKPLLPHEEKAEKNREKVLLA